MAGSADPGTGSQTSLRDVFAVDLRSLALWRIALASVLLIDLADRARFFGAHYTESGVLPVATLLEVVGPAAHLSFHALIGASPVAVAALFALNALVLVALLLGWHTRIAAVAAWYLLHSLQLRNPWLMFGGDSLVGMQLLWAMFLPLGARFSLDAKQREGQGAKAPANRMCTWATAAILIQIFFVYFVTGMHKADPRWAEGRALYYTLNLDQYATFLTPLLRQHDWLYAPLTHATRWLELLGPLLLFVPWRNAWFKMAAVAIFVPFHLGLAMFMSIGLFPLFSIAIWSVALPTAFWDEWLPRLQRLGGAMSDRASPSPPQGAPLRTHPLASAFVIVLLSYLVLHHAADLRFLRALPVASLERGKLPGWLHGFGSVFRLNQRWRMFAVPNERDLWLAVQGRLADGSEMDPFTGRRFTTEKPLHVPAIYPGFRWRIYTWRALHSPGALEAPELAHRAFADYLCREWNEARSAGQQLVSVRTIVMIETTQPDRIAEPVPREIWSGNCPQ